MSSKVEINQVAEAAKAISLPADQVKKLMDMLADMQPDTEEKPPAVKKQFVLLISDPDSLLPKTDFAGWVLQIPENESPATIEERIFRTAYDYNASRKGRLYPVKTVGEAIENVQARLFKESDVWIKTKTPVLVLRTDNEIPKANDTGKLPFQQLCEDHGATVTIKTGDKSVTIDGKGARCVETRDGRKITPEEMVSEIQANFAKGRDT